MVILVGLPISRFALHFMQNASIDMPLPCGYLTSEAAQRSRLPRRCTEGTTSGRFLPVFWGPGRHYQRSSNSTHGPDNYGFRLI